MTPEQGNLLLELGIAPDTPWVWIGSDGPLDGTGPAPRLQVDGPKGAPPTCPFPYEYSEKWTGYSILLVGVLRSPMYLKLAMGPVGLRWQWEDAGRVYAVEIWYQRATWYHQARRRSSALHAELVSSPRAILDGSIKGTHLKHTVTERAKAWGGMGLLLEGSQREKPGPKPGQVEAKKYKSAEQWHAAIREKVLTKKSRLSADDQTLAFWLGFKSTSTLFDYMRGWGPKTIADLREGRF